MVYRFLILSDEADDFKREIQIDSEATFLDLQNAILDSVGYTKDQMTSFFICDDDWTKKTDMELREIIPNKDLKEAVCTKSKGDAPVQIMPLDEFDNKLNNSTSDLDEDFYGDSEYNLDELDQDGFGGLGDGMMDNPYDDDRY